MKKILSLLLTLCLLFSILPTQALAAVGDIRPAENNAVKQTTLSSGSLALQNDYIRVIARKDGTLSTAPATESADPTDRQTPYCYFVTYGSRHITHPASLRLKSLTFVNKTPNGTAKAIRADYDLTVNLTKLTVSGTTSVYHELVQLKENELSEESWGVMVSVDNIRINEQDSEAFFQTLNTDVGIFWGYTLSGFTAMGHPKAADSPALKLGRTVLIMINRRCFPPKAPSSPASWKMCPHIRASDRASTGATTASPRSIRTATTGPTPLWGCRDTIATINPTPSRYICRIRSA